jgi:hypothetical protein
VLGKEAAVPPRDQRKTKMRARRASGARRNV